MRPVIFDVIKTGKIQVGNGTMFNRDSINELQAGGVLTSLDIFFARLMEDIAGKNDELFLAALCASSQTRLGHVCIDLAEMAEKDFGESRSIRLPFYEPWIETIRKSPVVGKPGDKKPLILDDMGRLYLYRYWEYQDILLSFIKSRMNRRFFENQNASEFLRQGLNRLFPDNNEEPDDQKIAAAIASVSGFTVITGGPGTGKTTTVTKILALYIETMIHVNEGKRPVVCLCAPTGKAAARLKESIGSALDKIQMTDVVRDMIPVDVTTIHRMLGSITGSPYFRYNAERKLPADLVIVDEASMVDLALMSKLVQALKKDAQLILIGDQDQLSSVETGSVLGDICNSSIAKVYSSEMGSIIKSMTGYDVPVSSNPPGIYGLTDSISVLTRSYRFSGVSGIGEASRALNAGDTEALRRAFHNNELNDIMLSDLPDPPNLKEILSDMVIAAYGPLMTSDFEHVFSYLERFRILCAVKNGPYGVTALNRLVEEILEHEKLINRADPWYHGRLVMITQNDYQLGVFNGDVGIILKDVTKGNRPWVFFPVGDGEIRAIKPEKLSAHETVYAMTVHKSQGSEFDRILMILPDQEVPVLTRELLYTGLTRSRNHVHVMAQERILEYTVSNQTRRKSGLSDGLWT